MHYTLHLTNDCNMCCKYCYVNGENICTMSIDTAKKVVDIAAESKKSSVGIIFFGGEPLLNKNLIYETVEYCKWKEKSCSTMFHYKITTNGLLLDDDFMDFSTKVNLFIAMSHDGIKEAHDKNRIDKNGEGTYSRLSEKIDLLLSKRSYAPVMMVVNHDTVQYYAESVKYLYNRGFKYLICSLNYAGNWTESSIKVLEQQYKDLAEFYYERTLAEDKFYLSPFEVKISSHINKDTYCHERCELGKKQISVGPDGLLYPCVQFVGDKQYSIGDVNTGIDENKRLELYNINEQEKESCLQCAIRERCNHYCGCLNKQTTGRIDRVSPVLCAHERTLMPIADKLANKLFKKRSGMFIQKHYNDMFPLISLVEDSTKPRHK